MFGVSFGEILVVLIVAFILLGPENFIEGIKSFKNVSNKLRSWYMDFMSYLKSELEHDQFIDIFVDDEGNSQKVYDIEKIKPFLNSTNDKNDEPK
jgi:Sec-independent protein translocase protein TatA